MRGFGGLAVVAAAGLATFGGALGCGKGNTPPDAPTEGRRPAAADELAATREVTYPGAPKGPPPVPPPPGQGLEVPLQRYIAIDQFGYRTKMTKVAVLVDPERGWNAADNYEPRGNFEVRRWSDGWARMLLGGN